MKRLNDIDKANSIAFEKLLKAEPQIVDLGMAKDAIPNFGEKMILHAGPPITWERMSGPMIGAITGAILYEGWAETPEKARALASKGEITFEPCHHHNSVGPMAGIISPNLPVWVVEEKNSGRRGYATLNEGLGKVLRMGAFSEEVIERLNWMREVLYPVLRNGVRKYVEDNGGLNLKSLISQSLHMGDELHNRNRAATSLLIRTLVPSLIDAERGNHNLSRVVKFMAGNDHFFLNPGMAAAKASLDSVGYVEGSSMITIMARNGTDFGIQIAGIENEWFTCQAALPDVLLFPGFTKDDVNRDIGDSAIMETYGVGGFALAAAPAIVQFVGGTPQDAVNYTKEMYEICVGENKHFTIPVLNFRGTPTGIDLIKVVETGITPILDTGAAHKEAGKGQVGAGIVRMPSEAFVKAAEAFVEKYSK
ncbi:DUF1116 domain-containing protein [Mesotoga prima]|uniref:DUF1116 domain-containing protein n=1 Tax=Mesotoga prima TaxID=1184387 RepID=UPI002C205388|nr:DUF1116 domain-containing protein [Mesotoga prima]HQN60772.1 DUF1116 domain-containing protein [Mesotoga prima]